MGKRKVANTKQKVMKSHNQFWIIFQKNYLRYSTFKNQELFCVFVQLYPKIQFSGFILFLEFLKKQFFKESNFARNPKHFFFSKYEICIDGVPKILENFLSPKFVQHLEFRGQLRDFSFFSKIAKIVFCWFWWKKFRPIGQNKLDRICIFGAKSFSSISISRKVMVN